MDSSKEKILMEPYNYILQVPGKRIREKLIQAFNVWLKIPEEKLNIISDVVKMLHNSSLMIDDIEDNSKLRRGIPVTHNIFGVAQTINSANYMYFKALEKVLSLDHPGSIHIFTEELLELHHGQGMDIYWRDLHTCPTEDEYREMVRKKTGGLFRVAVRLMQLFTENKSEDTRTVNTSRIFWHKLTPSNQRSLCKKDFLPLLDTLGLYFQIRDDYANLQSEEYRQNKSYCEDLTEGKFSFPIIHGIRHDPSSTKIINILKQRTEDMDVKKYCIDCLEQSGSFAYTRNVLKELEEKALQLIEELGGNSQLTNVVHQLSKISSK